MTPTRLRARLEKLESQAGTKIKKLVEMVDFGLILQAVYGGEYQPVYGNPNHSDKFMSELEKIYGDK